MFIKRRGFDFFMLCCPVLYVLLRVWISALLLPASQPTWQLYSHEIAHNKVNMYCKSFSHKKNHTVHRLLLAKKDSGVHRNECFDERFIAPSLSKFIFREIHTLLLSALPYRNLFFRTDHSRWLSTLEMDKKRRRKIINGLSSLRVLSVTSPWR